MNKKAMEIQTLVIMVLAVVFLLVMLAVLVIIATDGNVFSGAGNLCEQTGFFTGCSP